MALATSGTINLTDVRDFYGQSGSINMTNLHKGESNIPNPTTYGSATEGKGSTVGGTSGSIQSGASYMSAGNNSPHQGYSYGGVVPSLDTEANSSIPTSGSIDLTDYYGGYRIVNPTAGSISGSTSGLHGRGIAANSGATPTAYLSWYGGNYADLAANLDVGTTSNYCQLITVQSNQYIGSYTGSVTCSFTLSHAGIYTLNANVTGVGGTAGTSFINISGTGISLKSHTGVAQSIGSNILLNEDNGINPRNRLFELTHTNTSATITLTCGGTGGSTQAQIRTNTNYLRQQNTSDTTVYNDMLTQS